MGIVRFFMIGATAAVLLGCAEKSEVSIEVVSPMPEISKELLESEEVTVLAEFGELSLVPDNESDYFIGMPAVIKVIAKNVGATELNMGTWFAREQDNLIFHYTPCDIEGNLFDPEQSWMMQRPVINTPVYYPLILMPGNMVEASAELEFIGKLPEGTKSSHYLVMVQLNNPKVELKTLPFVINVLELDLSDVEPEIP